MSRCKIKTIGIAASLLVLVGSLIVLHNYIQFRRARDGFLTECVVHWAYLETLDSDKLTAEEKVSRLKKHAVTMMAMYLGVLEYHEEFSSEDLSVSDLMRFDMGLVPHDDFKRTKKNIEDYLTARAKSKHENSSSESDE